MERHTFHDCAKELRTTSHQFRSASLALKNGAGGGHSEQAEAASREGTSILRTLALAVRSEQDYGLASLPGIDVGALREEASEYEARAILNEYRPPVSDLAGYEPLRLREALNKIAHADPRGATQVQDGKSSFDGWNLCGVWFFADLSGLKTDLSVVARHGSKWLA